MAIGLNIGNGARIELGEIREELLNDLDSAHIEYTIPFDKTNKQNIKETIIQIKDLEMEVSVENDIITYIKSANNEFTNLDCIDNLDNIFAHIKTIQEHIANSFGSEYKVKIEKIDTKNLSIIVILSSEYEKARAIVARDGNGNIYINTLRTIE